jgi:hypothetical protein
VSRPADIPRPRTATTVPESPEESADQPDPGQIRASDAEREDTVRLLHQGLSEGRLDLAETETRVAAAYAVAYRGELPPLLGDLPQQRHDAEPPLDGHAAPSWETLWTALVWRARVSLWDGPAAARRVPPGPRQRRLAALLFVLAGLWLLAWAVIGAVL